VGGLPVKVVCNLAELAPGGSQSLDLVALVRPWYRNGNGVDEAPVATVSLLLQGHLIDPATVDLDLPEPPIG
jgi:hypothetical protein